MPDTPIIVSYATGRYEDYVQHEMDNPVPGRLYYLYDDNDNTYIFLNGTQYNRGSGGSDDPNNIIFENSITVTTDTGNYPTGYVIPAKTSLASLIQNMLSKDIYPDVKVYPTVSISNTSWTGIHEIGTVIAITYRASLSGGVYTVEGQGDQAGGVVALEWAVTSNVGGINDHKTTTASDRIIESSDPPTLYQLTDTSVRLQLTATAVGSIGNMPKTFLGEDYPSKRFAENTNYQKLSSRAECYRAILYGWASNTTVDYSAFENSSQIRAADIGGKVSEIPDTLDTTNMQEMFFAAPHGRYTNISVTNTITGLPQTVYKYNNTLNVEGANNFTAIAYDVWYIQNALPETGDSTFRIVCS